MGFTEAADGALTITDDATDPGPAGDMQAIVDLAMDLGGVLKVTAAERELLTGGQTRVGWLIVETDTGRIYKRTAAEPQGELILWDSGWIELTNVGLFTSLDGIASAYRVMNGMVTIRVSAAGTIGQGLVVAVASGLPAAFRPAATTGIVRGGAVMGIGGFAGGVTVFPTGHVSAGQVAIANFSGADRTWASAMISYPLG